MTRMHSHAGSQRNIGNFFELAVASAISKFGFDSGANLATVAKAHAGR